MSDTQLTARAATPLLEIIRNIKPDQLDAPTPCAEYDVRRLLNHLLFWGPSLEGAARKETVPPPAESDSAVDLTGGDWAADVETQLNRIVDAWSKPRAWAGTTHMGGPTELPAALVGGMVLSELVVHGWDLAKATGQHLVVADDVAGEVHKEVTKTATLGREMGAYGPEVPVPASSSTVDRVLGLTGRDPAWTP
ncbi:TIGR03086 family protein [Amycolatopsis marina]|uniref:TIGR03086 family protein n=1 Tax=Amycolatopsis marina TaxID=490629 RepID=A0A1I0YKX6_9PSEU|nr:TIGR03086 family metal-binding protein [Amycolatopsis marina]SFB13984.1 TIGR03086 family protein [Amycolatopsis marina]